MADSMSATPRTRPIIGTLADLVGYIDRFARAPGGYDNPPAAMLSDFLSVPQIQRTLDRLSYGEPLTNAGKANVPLVPADTADAAMAVAPIAAKFPRATLGAVAGLAGAVGDAGAMNQAMAYMTRDDLIGKLSQLAAENKGRKLGLRVMPDDQTGVSVGDIAPNSWVWKNGEYTNRRMDGVSTASMGRGSSADIKKAIDALGLYAEGPNGHYFGPEIALISGDDARRGVDAGERVIRNGVVVWKEENPRYAKDRPK